MKKASITLFVILVSAISLAAVDKIETRQDLESFIQTYYQNPNPEIVSAAITFLDRNGDLQVNAIPGVMGFFSCIFNDNVTYRDRWKQEIEVLHGNVKDTLSVAFNTIPEVLMAKIGPSASQNEMCWGAFYASGDTRFIEKITDQTIYQTERDDLNLFFTGLSAKCSLADNARKHQSVREYIEERIKNCGETSLKELLTREPEDFRKDMDRILNSEKKRGWSEATLKRFAGKTEKMILKLIGKNEQ